MYIGEDADGVAAMMVISTDGLVPNNVQQAIRAVDGVQVLRAVRLGWRFAVSLAATSASPCGSHRLQPLPRRNSNARRWRS